METIELGNKRCKSWIRQSGRLPLVSVERCRRTRSYGKTFIELEQEDRGKGRAGWSEWGKHVGQTCRAN